MVVGHVDLMPRRSIDEGEGEKRREKCDEKRNLKELKRDEGIKEGRRNLKDRKEEGRKEERTEIKGIDSNRNRSSLRT